jgi:tetratricopeptide (TPR) repeat protein
MRKFGAVAAALALAACSASARDALDQARKALAQTHYSEAIAAADAGLARRPDPVTSWGLELAKLEALARMGRGDETVAQLQKLTDAWPDHMAADQFAATADQLRAAGQGGAAIQALDLGLKRFPQDPALRGQIEQAKAAPAPGSDELKMLESLGYLGAKK